MRSHASRWLILAISPLLLIGCERPKPTLAPPPPPEVIVETPTTQDVVEYEDFIGRTEALVSVELRSRVTGYLNKVHFVEGADVQENQLLFSIDPKLYQAEFDRTEAAVKQEEALVARLTKDYERAKMLQESNSISLEEFDRVSGDKAQAEAALQVALAAKQFAQQNLNYTQIRAPFSGRISRQFVDPGNLVKADETTLTSIVKLNPIYAYFDVDDRTLLELRRANKSMSQAITETGKDSPKPIQVEVGLPDRDQFELQGTVNFFDNRVDPGTSTLRFRAQIENPDLLLSPGLFVRVRLRLGTVENAILVPEEAIGSNQEHKFVFVVEEGNVVREQRIILGSLHDGKRVVKSGLTGTERIIVSGLQKVRPKGKVTLKEVPSPSRPAPQPSSTPPTDAARKPAANSSPVAGS